MIRNPALHQVVFVDYDNEGFEKLARVLAIHRDGPSGGVVARVQFLKDFSFANVWVDFLFEVMETFVGPIMVDWRAGLGSEPVEGSPTNDEGTGRGS